MASGSFNLTRTGSTSSYVNFLVNWSSYSNGASANSSTVHVAVYVQKSSSSTSNTWGTTNTSVTVEGSTQSENGLTFTVAPSGSTLIFAKNFTVSHNANGTKSTTISVNVGGNVVWGNGSKSITLDTIPRYATITQFKATSVTNNSVTLAISADVGIDYVQYSLNNGSFINLPTNNTITGLEDGTTYSIKIKVRRTDSQLWTTSSAISVTTLKNSLMKLKTNGVWKEAISYLKINGVWKEAKPYIKVNGIWKEGV